MAADIEAACCGIVFLYNFHSGHEPGGEMKRGKKVRGIRLTITLRLTYADNLVVLCPYLWVFNSY